MFVNLTHIRIAQGRLTVLHGPIPFLLKEQRIPAASVKQIYVRQNKDFENHRPAFLYTIHVQLIDGSSKRLWIPDNLTATECRQIEQALEDHLGITNEPVPGRIHCLLNKVLRISTLCLSNNQSI